VKEFFKPSGLKIILTIVIFIVFIFFIPIIRVEENICQMLTTFGPCSSVFHFYPVFFAVRGVSGYQEVSSIMIIVAGLLEIIVSYVLACCISLIIPKKIKTEQK
jgi:hypothetical protein